MQIDRRPNRGPYVAALICLLMLCLTIPLYWQSSARRALEQDDDAHSSTSGGGFFRIDRDSVGLRPSFAIRRPGDEAIDTLDELLFQLANRPGGITSNQPDVFMELLGMSDSDTAEPAEENYGVVWQYASNALRDAGQKLGELAPGEKLVALAGRCASGVREEEPRSERLPMHSLLLTNPKDRLAMLPCASREWRSRQLTLSQLPGACPRY